MPKLLREKGKRPKKKMWMILLPQFVSKCTFEVRTVVVVAPTYKSPGETGGTIGFMKNVGGVYIQ